jgi:thiol-disulfide isomerase/thioredoxin
VPTDRELRLAIGAALALVFAVAAIAKLRDRRGFASTLRDFGLAGTFAAAVGVAIPAGELLVALLLVVPATTIAGGALALLVLYAFTLVAGGALLLDKKPDCRCFGELRPTPVGAGTILRNALFAAAAAFVAWPVLSGLIREVALVGVTGLALMLGAVVSRLRRRLSRRAAEAPTAAQPITADARVGEPAPAFDLPAAAGGRGSLATLTASGKPAVLLFMGVNCQVCHRMVPTIKAWHQQHRSRFTLAVTMRDSPAANFMFDQDGPDMLLQMKQEVSEAYGVALTPAAVLIDTNRRYASALATGPEEITRLVESVVSGRLPAGTPPAAPV